MKTWPLYQRFRYAAFALAVALGTGVMCPQTMPNPDEGNVGISPSDFPDLRVSGEPNDEFGIPLDVIFFSNGKAQLQGTIDPAGDVDVFNLGFVPAGTRIVADFSTPGANNQLDAAAALFDAQQRIIIENDDRNFALSQYDPLIDVVTRYDAINCYLAVASYPGDLTSGAYTIEVTKANASIPAAAPQNVILDFDGGTVAIPFDTTYTVGVFDASDIAFTYRNDTELMRQLIIAVVMQRFEGLDIEFFVTPDDNLPPLDDASTVLFGGFNASAFGISEGVDAYNFDRCDNSIIFVETFDPNRFGMAVSVEDMAIAIGNVAAHEIGHLLGLNHVSNLSDLMDTTGGARSLLADQQFMTSPLHHSIFPIGDQDGALLLIETIGSQD